MHTDHFSVHYYFVFVSFSFLPLFFQFEFECNMAAVDSGVETESESLEDSSNSLPPTPKVAGAEEEALYGVRF